MNVQALMTARKGSKSVRNKNTLLVDGVPMFLHNINYCLRSEKIDKVFLSTDIENSRELGVTDAVEIIERPIELRGDDASHYETIRHGLLAIEERVEERVDILVVVLGNTVTAFSEDLDRAISILEEQTDHDSVISVSEFNMFNPFRAYCLNVQGRLDTIVPQRLIKEYSRLKNTNDKNAAGDVYFFNGSFWAIRRRTIMENSGLLPFTWLGTKIYPLIQPVCMEIDAYWQLDWLGAAHKVLEQ